jgi:hypothetical protein
MANLFKNKAKLILIFYIIVIVALFVFGLFFMTNYVDVHIAYSVDKYEGTETILIERYSVFQSEKITNDNLFKYFNYASNFGDSNLHRIAFSALPDSDEVYAIYDFHNYLNGVNTYIVVSSIISVALCALFFVFSNNNRRIYYKSNVIIGVIVPLVITILTVVSIVLLISCTSKLNADIDLYRVTAATMNKNALNYVEDAYTDWNVILENSKSVNSITFIVGIIISVLVIAYSAFIAIFSIKKYKETGKERSEIISRAVTVND